MAEAHVISALVEKRARVHGELIEARLRAFALKVDLDHIDACLRIFRSNIEPETIPPKVTFGKSPAGLRKGVVTRTALEILRETGDAMSAQELAACILQRHEKPLDPLSLSLAIKALHSNFSRRKDGIVSFSRDTYPGKWRLTGA